MLNLARTIAIGFVVLTFVAGCGGSGDGSSGGSSFTGTWSIVTENGATPAASGYTSVIMTLTESTYSSRLEAPTFFCSWSGLLTNTATTMTVIVDTIDGADFCNQAVGRETSNAWSLSDGDNTLTLDWRGGAPNGTLQVYSRQ